MNLPDIIADRPDWRDDQAYACTVRLTRREWAWEFLRRNSEFQRDLKVALDHAVVQKEGAAITIVNSSLDLTKWGVMFRDVGERGRCRLLVPAALSIRSSGAGGGRI
ncbi:transcriptional regulator domain-containing protein [Kordiimonas sp.]|uniref:transcriptional regulator domain-containing protein n=1 Tax=Kordiimonas sp. TaxID=1970157 RepID=UPI003A9230BD